MIDENVLEILKKEKYILIDCETDTPNTIYGSLYDKTKPTAAITALIAILGIFCTEIPNGNKKIYTNALNSMIGMIRNCVTEVINIKTSTEATILSNNIFGSTKKNKK